jgi:mRNA-degrading endonuclease RelE of RelBE toxin-antitoxin system
MSNIEREKTIDLDWHRRLVARLKKAETEFLQAISELADERISFRMAAKDRKCRTRYIWRWQAGEVRLIPSPVTLRRELRTSQQQKAG